MATLLNGEVKDLDGFSVTRILPHKAKKMVGPFIFLDHMGPALFKPGEGVNVRPHPHIGLSTLTYLFSGSMLHRDSLGNVQEIHPGDVNWMTAGRGIVHSERETLEVRSREHELNGLQFWLALPPHKAEIAPSFQHIKREDLPHRYAGKTVLRLVAGEAFGMTSPVRTHSPMFFADVVAHAGDRVSVPEQAGECAVYIQSGELNIDGQLFCAGDFVLLDTPDDIQIQSSGRFVILGGEPFAETPYIRWNFVAYSRERIKQAEEDWKAQRFAVVPGDDEEFTPLPGL
ncbi:pirin family protein [Thalassolituus sp. LLYu03]|uniref:pirin family protein n=1 Tax=Thalassolituus sp. LLYu03 TaxID=3421656 RepID=UPI003D2BDC87